MRNAYVIILAFLLFSSPIFAAGTLTVTKGVASTPSYINTRDNTVVISVILNATTDNVNISAINITIFNATVTDGNITGNISNIFVYNDTNNNSIIDSADSILATNSSVTSNFTILNFSSAFTVPKTSLRTILIVVNVSSSATRFISLGVNITANTSITTAAADTISFPVSYINSTLMQIQDVHASASISPRVVDTNVTNQTLVYVITPTGADRINSTVINIPSGYTFIGVNATTIDGSNTSGSYNLVGNIIGSTQLRINYTGAGQTNQPIIVYFVINTSLTSVSSIEFNSTISGSNVTNATTSVTNFATNVTTRQLINVTRVTTIKNTAYLNGTDYWEFNFTFNFTANVSGSIQFAMNNWTNFEGTANISLTNGTDFYAPLRDGGNTSRIINISNTYNQGLNITNCCTTNTVYSLVLRMVIPSTVTTVSSGWWTTYIMLFRSEPS